MRVGLLKCHKVNGTPPFIRSRVKSALRPMPSSTPPAPGPNPYTVAGFSGHGMMHAPAAGRAIAELVVHERYQTIDLPRFGYERVEAGEPYREEGVL